MGVSCIVVMIVTVMLTHFELFLGGTGRALSLNDNCWRSIVLTLTLSLLLLLLLLLLQVLTLGLFVGVWTGLMMMAIVAVSVNCGR